MKRKSVLVLMMVATMAFAGTGCGNASAEAPVSQETQVETKATEQEVAETPVEEETPATEAEEETPATEEEAVEVGLDCAYGAPEGYDEYQVMGYYFEETDETIPVMVGTNSDHNQFHLHFDFFGDEQILIFHLDGETPVVDEDKSGFMTKDVDKLYAAVLEIPTWNKVGEEAGAETAAEIEAPYEAPEGYDKYQVINYYFEETDEDIPMMVGADNEQTKFQLHFDFFGDEQILEYHIEDGANVVDYDKSGFMTKDVDKLNDAVQSANNWVTK